MELKEGSYKAKPVSAYLGVSKNGKEQVEVVFALYDGEEISGVERSAYLYFTGGAIQRSVEALKTCGFTGTLLSDLSSISEATSPDVELVFANESWEGKERLKIKYINPITGRAPRVPHPDADRFARLMQDHFKAPVEEAPAKKGKKITNAPF